MIFRIYHSHLSNVFSYYPLFGGLFRSTNKIRSQCPAREAATCFIIHVWYLWFYSMYDPEPRIPFAHQSLVP